MAVGGIGGPGVFGPGSIGIEIGLGIGSIGLIGLASEGIVGRTTASSPPVGPALKFNNKSNSQYLPFV